MKALWYDTSKLDPIKGITFRGYSVPDLSENLPTAGGDNDQALPEGKIWLLMGDSIPTQEEFLDV